MRMLKFVVQVQVLVFVFLEKLCQKKIEKTLAPFHPIAPWILRHFSSFIFRARAYRREPCCIRHPTSSATL